MKIVNVPGQPVTITEADGVVWTEPFTLADLSGLSEWIERVAPSSIASPHAQAAQRPADALFALTNDSAAVIVTSTVDLGLAGEPT